MTEPLTIVVVEEDRDRAIAIVDALKDAGGCEVHVIGNVSGLSRRISAHAPDVVLIDIDNPTRDMLEELTLASGPLDRPVAMFVSGAASGLARAAVEAGVSAYVVDGLRPERLKPVNIKPDVDLAGDFRSIREVNDEIRRLPLDNPRGEMTVLVSGPGQSVGTGVYSPDGRWVAFGLFIGTDWQTYVMPAEGGERRWQVSTDGAVYPVWAPDGRRLFLSGTKGDILVYEVDGSGSTFRTGSHRTISTPYSPDPSGKYYDLHPDGRRILQSRGDPAARSETSPLHLVTDWRREAAR